MTTQHKLGQYMDGRIPIAYCKVCSAEGDKLFDECSGPIPFATNFRLLTKEEFLERYPKALDAENLPDK